MKMTGTALAAVLVAAAVLGAASSARAENTASGPVAALDKARAAVAVSARRAAQSDAQAASAFGAAEGASGAAPQADAPVATVGSAGVAATAGSAEKPVAGAANEGQQPAAVAATGQYDPTKHRDPFRPPNLLPTVTEGPKTPLEGYEIGQLRLVGIISGGHGARAMVEDSAGLGYIVTTGTPIGSRGGVVQRIEDRRMLIEETTTNFYGEKQPREVVMELPQEDRSP